MPNVNSHIVLITGAGYRAPKGWTANPLTDEGVKLNIGAAVAIRAATLGYRIAIAGRRPQIVDSLFAGLAARFPSQALACAAFDVTNECSVANFVQSLPTDDGIDLVQSVGLSSGHYEVKDDNPYACIEDLNPSIMTAELTTPIMALVASVRALLPIWMKRPPSRAIIVNSMSAVRAYRRGVSHASSKGALHQAVRSLCLELYSRNVFLSEINPGIVDTGLYDRESVKLAVRDIAASFGQDLSGKDLPAMSPEAVADAAMFALTSASHIVQVNMVASGQFPNLGA